MLPDANALGATVGGGGVTVRVWAPRASGCLLVIDGRELAMEGEGGGVFAAWAEGAGAGSRYGFRMVAPGGAPGPVFPDPHSRGQPDGVHGLSEVIDPHAYRWGDAAWMAGPAPRVPLGRLVFYELHVGTFTPEGTFAAAAGRLEYLRDLGVTAVELMPLHAFPGRYGWGYDPAAFFAAPAAYGSPDDLRRLVDRAHAVGLAIYVDVVLNHLGPDGAYVNAFAPMVIPAATPWGAAVNLGEPGVRRFLREAALIWLTEYHADGLRLDATSSLHDDATEPFLASLSAAVEALPGPRRLLIAEDLTNRAVITRPRALGGHGVDSQWVDDLAAMARLLAGDDQPFHGDYAGASASTLAATLREGWWLTDPVVRRHDRFAGTAPEGPLARVTHYLDDHDQAGNRPHGEPFAALAPPSLWRALVAILLFSPQRPLLWMGQEWASRSPFPFFADLPDRLAQDVRRGRLRAYRHSWRYEGDPPDPLAPGTFAAARLDWEAAARPEGVGALALHRRLLALRAALDADDEAPWQVEAPEESALWLRRGDHTLLVALRAGVALPDPGGDLIFSTEDADFCVDGAPPRREAGEVRFGAASALLLCLTGRPRSAG
jgi:maltooligosyltrehalose trehalohydrolase